MTIQEMLVFQMIQLPTDLLPSLLDLGNRQRLNTPIRGAGEVCSELLLEFTVFTDDAVQFN